MIPLSLLFVVFCLSLYVFRRYLTGASLPGLGGKYFAAPNDPHTTHHAGGKHTATIHDYGTASPLANFTAAQPLDPGADYRTWFPLGLNIVWQQLRAFQEHKILEMGLQRFRLMAPFTTIRGSVLGKTFISTIEPANIKAILATQFSDFCLDTERKIMLEPLLGKGIFTSDAGAGWEESRALIRPCFTKAGIDEFCRRSSTDDDDDDGEGRQGLFERHVQSLVKAIEVEQVRGHGVVDLQPLFFTMTLDVATEFLFGKSSNLLDDITTRKSDAEDKETDDAATTTANDAASFVRSYDHVLNTIQGFVDNGFDDKASTFRQLVTFVKIFLPDNSKKQHAKTMNAFADKIVRDAIAEQRTAQHTKEEDGEPASGKQQYIFLPELIAQTDNVAKIRSELLNVLLAARDTTASLLSNVWFEIARRPQVYDDLQTELRDAGFLPSSSKSTSPPDLSFSTLKSLKYLQASLSESLRLYPIVAENQRQAARDTTLPLGGGPDGQSPLVIKKGWVTHWSLWTMHRRHDLYGEDAEDFKPERWLKHDPSTTGESHSDAHGDTHNNDAAAAGQAGLKGWSYLPFNGGPRVCIGQQFALTEAAYITVRLLQEFATVKSRDPLPWREKVLITITGLGGCKVNMTRRDAT